jgi:hypothetical protein
MLAAVVAAATVDIAMTRALDAATMPRGWSPHREVDEVASVAEADVETIYAIAIRFYRPPRNQSRWLDLRLLPAAASDSTPPSLDHGLAERLVGRLGRRFCVLERGNGCDGSNGAVLRLSRIYATTPDRVRVVVGCRLVWPGNTTTDNGGQAFLLNRTAKGWVIAGRHGVTEP